MPNPECDGDTAPLSMSKANHLTAHSAQDNLSTLWGRDGSASLLPGMPYESDDDWLEDDIVGTYGSGDTEGNGGQIPVESTDQTLTEHPQAYASSKPDASTLHRGPPSQFAVYPLPDGGNPEKHSACVSLGSYTRRLKRRRTEDFELPEYFVVIKYMGKPHPTVATGLWRKRVRGRKKVIKPEEFQGFILEKKKQLHEELKENQPADPKDIRFVVESTNTKYVKEGSNKYQRDDGNGNVIHYQEATVQAIIEDKAGRKIKKRKFRGPVNELFFTNATEELTKWIGNDQGRKNASEKFRDELEHQERQCVPNEEGSKDLWDFAAAECKKMCVSALNDYWESMLRIYERYLLQQSCKLQATVVNDESDRGGNSGNDPSKNFEANQHNRSPQAATENTSSPTHSSDHQNPSGAKNHQCLPSSADGGLNGERSDTEGSFDTYYYSCDGYSDFDCSSVDCGGDNNDSKSTVSSLSDSESDNLDHGEDVFRNVPAVEAPWKVEEDRVILECHATFGNEWSEIAKLVPDRTGDAIKGRWDNTIHLKLVNFLAKKSGIGVEAVRPGSDGRYDIGHDLEGALVAVRDQERLPSLSELRHKHDVHSRLDRSQQRHGVVNPAMVGYPGGRQHQPQLPCIDCCRNNRLERGKAVDDIGMEMEKCIGEGREDAKMVHDLLSKLRRLSLAFTEARGDAKQNSTMKTSHPPSSMYLGESSQESVTKKTDISTLGPIHYEVGGVDEVPKRTLTDGVFVVSREWPREERAPSAPSLISTDFGDSTTVSAVSRVVKAPFQSGTATTQNTVQRKHTSNSSQQHRGVDSLESGAARVFGRLTVLQAQPLVWFDRDSNVHPVFDPLNLEEEKEVLLAVANYAHKISVRMDISIEAATTNRLAAFLAEGESQFLHLSCHGHSDYLAFEGHRGAMQVLKASELKDLVSTASEKLKLVFVSACHSRAAGEALVAAGCPHVVCCQQGEELQDAAAIEFTRNFYRSLVCGQHLLRAFQLAKAAVAVSPSVNGHQGFLLLPEKPVGDSYHDVLLSTTRSQQKKTCSRRTRLPNRILPSTHGVLREKDVPASQAFQRLERAPLSLHHPMTPARNLVSSRILPAAPYAFVGREIEMYEILEALRHARLVQITGRKGIGKSTFAQALCRYVDGRLSTFLLDEVFWLPPLDLFYDGDELSVGFRELLELDCDDGGHDMETRCRHCCGNVVRHLQGRRAFIFIDVGEVASEGAMTKIQIFVEVLLGGTEHVSVVLVCPSGEMVSGKKVSVDSTLDLAPLNMKAAVLLFASKCRFVESSGRDDFVKLLVPDAQADATTINKSMSKRCAEIFSIVGMGFPDAVLEAAEEMTLEKFHHLEKVGLREEFQRRIDTRVVLDQEIKCASKKLASAIEWMDYKQAEKEKATLDELTNLRESLPTLAELRVQEAAQVVQLEESIASRDFSGAQNVDEELQKIREEIKREERAKLNLAGSEKNKNRPGRQQKVTFHQKGGTLSRVAEFLICANEFEFTVAVSHGSITDFTYPAANVAIVVATNESLFPVFGGATGAVIKAGGVHLADDISMLPVDDNDWGEIRCKIGEAKKVGPGSYDKLQVRFVIFAVGPSYVDIDKRRRESLHVLRMRDEQLKSAYRCALELASLENLEAVAFSLISAGSKAGDHHERILRVALETACNFEGYDKLKEIHLCAYESFHGELLAKIAKEMGLVSGSRVPSPLPRKTSFSKRMQSLFGRNSSSRMEDANQVSRNNSSHLCTYSICPRKLHGEGGVGSFALTVVAGCITGFCSASRLSAIVCSTNESLFPVQGSVDAAIGHAGGAQFRNYVKKYLSPVGTKEQGEVWCPTGEARIIGPQRFGELQVDYVIFAVGPEYSVVADDQEEKDEQLRNAYRACLELAKEAKLNAIAFSLLSGGKRAGGDYVRPIRIALETVSSFGGYKELQEICLYGFWQREVDTLNELALEMGLLPKTTNDA